MSSIRGGSGGDVNTREVRFSNNLVSHETNFLPSIITSARKNSASPKSSSRPSNRPVSLTRQKLIRVHRNYCAFFGPDFMLGYKFYRHSPTIYAIPTVAAHHRFLLFYA